MSQDLKPGAQGLEVSRVQVALNNQKVFVQQTGKYDAQTEKAVRKFQADHKLPVTGIVDDMTSAWLFPYKKVNVHGQVFRCFDLDDGYTLADDEPTSGLKYVDPIKSNLSNQPSTPPMPKNKIKQRSRDYSVKSDLNPSWMFQSDYGVSYTLAPWLSVPKAPLMPLPGSSFVGSWQVSPSESKTAALTIGNQRAIKLDRDRVVMQFDMAFTATYDFTLRALYFAPSFGLAIQGTTIL